MDQKNNQIIKNRSKYKNGSKFQKWIRIPKMDENHIDELKSKIE